MSSWHRQGRDQHSEASQQKNGPADREKPTHQDKSVINERTY